MKKVLLSWSSGKDSAWALHWLRQQEDVELMGLLTTINETFDRVAMHAVRRQLLEAQARAADLPLFPVMIPFPCSNQQYEERMGAAVAQAVARGVTHVAFGDLFLEDVRDYRIKMMAGTGMHPLFPLWGKPTGDLARQMVDEGLRATLTCVDPKQIPDRFVGRSFDHAFLDDLPSSVDPCGERGEFHTFCHAGPMFRHSIEVKTGERVTRDGFVFADLLPFDPTESEL